MLFRSDNKILVVGSKQGFGNTNLAVRRYNISGSIDQSFNAGQIVSVDFSGGDDHGYAIKLQPDGKILLAASVSDLYGNESLGLARLLSEGSLDMLFDTDGRVTMNADGDVAPSAIIVQPDGKILAAGTMNDVMYNSKMIVGRWLAGGRADSTWGTYGVSVI